jgi:hypothetical protein
MWTIFFGIIALALAIPSWGGSIVIFFWLKNKVDKMAVLQIIDMAKKSVEEGRFKQLHRINNAAINKVYLLRGVNVYRYSLEQYHEANKAGILRTDFHGKNNIIYPSIQHPEIGEIYLYLSQTTGNKVNIYATRPTS